MKKLEKIKLISEIMKDWGISTDDINAFCSNQSEQPSSPERLPLEILYKGGYRSFYVESDKTPVAIIIGNLGVAFEDAPEPMNWKDAKAYCKKYRLDGKKWSLPDKDAGHLEVLYKNKAAINEVLQDFGKEPLKEYWYWSTEYANYGAWRLGIRDGLVTNYSKYSTYYVLPICIL